MKVRWSKIVMVLVGVIVIGSMNIAFASESSTTKDWGLGFGAQGKQPTGTGTVSEMKKYDAYYMGKQDEKVIYITFDCGYENGNTPKILDALRKHNAKATFFVVGHFLESSPELVKRMVEEGHSVGNHTYHHRDMPKITQRQEFEKELRMVEVKFKEVTGKQIDNYYRPPQGKYNIVNLNMAMELGYKTFFWSLAYADWNVDKQPSHSYAIDKLTKRIHNGAVVLLHNTSRTNGEILDEILTKWEEMGYEFKPLSYMFQENSDIS